MSDEVNFYTKGNDQRTYILAGLDPHLIVIFKALSEVSGDTRTEAIDSYGRCKFCGVCTYRGTHDDYCPVHHAEEYLKENVYIKVR